MIKRLIPFAAAFALFFSAEALQAQAGGSCSSKKSASKCAKKCKGSKQKKSEEKSEEIQFSSITYDQLLQLMEENVYVIDARGEESYNKGHIEGAVLFSHFTLPEDKDVAMVFYCGGPRCSAAPRAARKVLKDGYTNVMVFRGGWLEWNENATSQAGL
ncbi:MAG: rhodanese-like domain-containing protein [Chlorobi bacterium]|nr:rhodanese-like domain-containing protein [Chlorobiota bacterium]